MSYYVSRRHANGVVYTISQDGKTLIASYLDGQEASAPCRFAEDEWDRAGLIRFDTLKEAVAAAAMAQHFA